MIPASEGLQDSLTVVSWNILLDKTRARLGTLSPQEERIASQAETLTGLERNLDVVMLQEVERENGVRLAELTGNEPGYWAQHNRKSERIGVFGGAVQGAEFHEIGNGRKAVVTYVGGVAIWGVHLSARPQHAMRRREESRALLELVEENERAMIVGDLNGPWFEPARRLLARRGFASAFREIGKRDPVTYPTVEYRDVMWTARQRRMLPRGVSIDAVLVRGVNVLSADSFTGDSDHRGLVVEVEK